MAAVATKVPGRRAGSGILGILFGSPIIGPIAALILAGIFFRPRPTAF